METLHTRLKRETAAAHGSLEAYIEAQRFFTSMAGYVAFLRASYAFQAEAEQVLIGAGATSVIPDWHLRHRAHLARQDLEVLEATTGQKPTAHGRLAEVSSAAGVLGVAYVVEGATLGGAIVLKAVAPLGISSRRGGTFLASYGPDRSAMWQSFLATLSHWERLGIEFGEVTNAAAATFEAARRHFETTATGAVD